MASKNLQNLVQCVAKRVVVTGMRKESMRADGSFQAPFLSLCLSPRTGPFPYGTNPDNQGFLRAGRSACELGVMPIGRTSASFIEAATKRLWHAAICG